MKNNNPLCPYDKMDCNANLDGYINCHRCERNCTDGYNGVRATDDMPGAEEVLNFLKKISTNLIEWYRIWRKKK